MRDTITIPAELFVTLCVAARVDDLSPTELLQVKHLRDLALLPRLHIQGRIWRSRTSGSPYCTFEVTANGEKVVHSSPSYGHGDQPLHDALQYLVTHYPAYVPGWDGGSATRYLREVIQATYDVCDVSRERDL